MDLREYLYRKNMTQKQLATVLGMRTTHLSMVINGKRPLSRRLAFKIVEWSQGNVTYDDLHSIGQIKQSPIERDK